MKKWIKFFKLVAHINADHFLDSRKNRFDKADLIEGGLEQCFEQLLWVDDIGHDMVNRVTGEKIEVKSQKNCLYTPKTGKQKVNSSQIKLTNTLGDASGRLLEKTFDFLYLIDTGGKNSYSVGKVDWSTVSKYATNSGDGFSVKIPSQEIQYLVRPDDMPEDIVEVKHSYSEWKKQAQSRFIKKIVSE